MSIKELDFKAPEKTKNFHVAWKRLLKQPPSSSLAGYFTLSTNYLLLWSFILKLLHRHSPVSSCSPKLLASPSRSHILLLICTKKGATKRLILCYISFVTSFPFRPCLALQTYQALLVFLLEYLQQQLLQLIALKQLKQHFLVHFL